MDITPIITVAELQDLTMNEDLLSICTNKPTDATKIINQVSIRLWGKIDKEIFYDEANETYVFPDDLKLACASLCECYYTYFIKEKNNQASSKLTSEKIDDYSYTYASSESAYSFFGIPTDSNVIAVIEAYTGIVGKGYWLINLH